MVTKLSEHIICMKYMYISASFYLNCDERVRDRIKLKPGNSKITRRLMASVLNFGPEI